ncbi:hypothetical protein STENM223S_07128 [Streptomyces tendae]
MLLLVPGLLGVLRLLGRVLLTVLVVLRVRLIAVPVLVTRAPVAVLLLRLLRVLLRLAAVGLLGLWGGLLSSPSAVPVQRVVRMPRIGALAPAILSHRSPRAARRRQPGHLKTTAPVPPLFVRGLFEHRPHRAERYRIAIR